MRLKRLRDLIEHIKNTDIVEVEYTYANNKIWFRRASPPQPGAPGGKGVTRSSFAPPPPEAREENKGQTENFRIIKSPMVGVFYRAPTSEAIPYVEVGDEVKEGATVGVIEAMRFMNEIQSDVNGRIAEILVGNGQTVEYGQPLFKVIPK
ncbi:MAG: acetyl-CoA carboxylase biotin carboxyl carrier protein [bacterium]